MWHFCILSYFKLDQCHKRMMEYSNQKPNKTWHTHIHIQNRENEMQTERINPAKVFTERKYGERKGKCVDIIKNGISFAFTFSFFLRPKPIIQSTKCALPALLCCPQIFINDLNVRIEMDEFERNFINDKIRFKIFHSKIIQHKMLSPN